MKLKSIDQEKRIALFEDEINLICVEYELHESGIYISASDRLLDGIEEDLTRQLTDHIYGRIAQKQERYTDEEGKDLIDEWAETYSIEIFRVLMWEQMRKYHRRLGKKDDIVLEVLKIADYARRWAEVESSR